MSLLSSKHMNGIPYHLEKEKKEKQTRESKSQWERERQRQRQRQTEGERETHTQEKRSLLAPKRLNLLWLRMSWFLSCPPPSALTKAVPWTCQVHRGRWAHCALCLDTLPPLSCMASSPLRLFLIIFFSVRHFLATFSKVDHSSLSSDDFFILSTALAFWFPHSWHFLLFNKYFMYLLNK